MSRTVLATLSLGLAAAATGCLTAPQGPQTGAVPTGDHVAVVDDVKVWTTTEKEKVGETEVRDADGNLVGKATSYQDKTTTHSMKIWYPVQGKEQLADEDFFHITGDQAALDRTMAMRADGKKWHHRGVYTMIGGGVGSLLGFLIPNAPVRTAVSSLGGLALAGGYYMTYYGAHEMSPDTHAVDRSIADRDANQYNATLGRTVGFGYGKKF